MLLNLVPSGVQEARGLTHDVVSSMLFATWGLTHDALSSMLFATWGLAHDGVLSIRTHPGNTRFYAIHMLKVASHMLF